MLFQFCDNYQIMTEQSKKQRWLYNTQIRIKLVQNCFTKAKCWWVKTQRWWIWFYFFDFVFGLIFNVVTDCMTRWCWNDEMTSWRRVVSVCWKDFLFRSLAWAIFFIQFFDSFYNPSAWADLRLMSNRWMKEIKPNVQWCKIGYRNRWHIVPHKKINQKPMICWIETEFQNINPIWSVESKSNHKTASVGAKPAEFRRTSGLTRPP